MAEEEEAVDYDEELKESRKGRGFEKKSKNHVEDRGGTYDRGGSESKGNALKCKYLVCMYVRMYM